ncbi:cathepsin G-like [Phacochoerus africanus]|uniref:cathepsin G-like n=1 Tax=Phacochoerus africanus TaxID=41426 RepID=UPI001FD9B55C|nr:cathepsin G-like [Phacochoerus africanus]
MAWVPLFPGSLAVGGEAPWAAVGDETYHSSRRMGLTANSPAPHALPFLPLPGPQRLAGGSTGSNRLGSPPENMQPLLLLMALLLPPGARAGEIIGGQEARPHSRPYMAYMHIQSAQGHNTCGGFLVRKDFVMTAAHCFGRQTVVILGAHNIRRFERTQQRIPVLRAIPHPRHNPQNNLNDIMLLQLANRARQNRFVRPVALPRTQARLSPGARCTVDGWGLVNLSRRTDTLQEVRLTVQRDGECHRCFRSYNGWTQMCVGDPRERKSAFSGDSGGPLVCGRVAQGIVSYGNRQGTPPEVFTRVSSFLPWIRRTMSRFQQRGQAEIPL